MVRRAYKEIIQEGNGEGYIFMKSKGMQSYIILGLSEREYFLGSLH